jgi:hypothetical protein
MNPVLFRSSVVLEVVAGILSEAPIATCFRHFRARFRIFPYSRLMVE